MTGAISNLTMSLSLPLPLSHHSNSPNPGYILLSVFTAFVLFLLRSSPAPLKPFPSLTSFVRPTLASANKSTIHKLTSLANHHEVASKFTSLVLHDGAGTWPPRSNFSVSAWPEPIRPYITVYEIMAPLLGTAEPSVDDAVNYERIWRFREGMRRELLNRVDMKGVAEVCRRIEEGRWDLVGRDVLNGWYCGIAWLRHAYRWGTSPAVKLAQLEKIVNLPEELVLPWEVMQRHFGLSSDSGNVHSSLLLNFTTTSHGDAYHLRINPLLPAPIQSTELEFAAIFRSLEAHSVPIYGSIIQSIIAYSSHNFPAVLSHVRSITSDLRPLLSNYYDRVHDDKIARSAWLSHVQGFYAWGVGYQEEGEWQKFDGLSGNQVLLFQVLDAFLGLEVYLPEIVLLRNVPVLQREFCNSVRRWGFRGRLGDGGIEGDIRREMGEIVKRLRVFRSAHRTRARVYLSQPAPERLPMTAGKSLLKEDMDSSLVYLDGFMLGRLQQTV